MLTERESKDGNSAPKSEKSTVVPLPPEGPGSRSFVHKTVSEELVPDLCRILIKAGPDGIVKVVSSFLQLHPSISKRQIELKVAEIAIKEKRPSDTTKIWHIRKEFEHYLNGAPKKLDSSAKKRKKSVDGSASTPSASTSVSASNEEVNTPNKRAKNQTPQVQPDDREVGSEDRKSKQGKNKSAFAFFVRANRIQVEQELGPSIEKEELKTRLLQKWESLPAADREQYERQERESKTN